MEVNTKQKWKRFLILFTLEIHHPSSTKDTKCNFKNEEQSMLKTNESRLHHLKKNAKMEKEKKKNKKTQLFNVLEASYKTILEVCQKECYETQVTIYVKAQ